jgi:type IV pilus assembly protein PilP
MMRCVRGLTRNRRPNVVTRGWRLVRLVRGWGQARLAGGWRLSVIALPILLAGCGGSDDFADLRAFMDEVRARPAPPVEALPTIVQAPPFAYQAGDMRSPFDPPVVLKRVERPAGGVRVEPDIRRQREYLEQFPVTSLAMVGSIAQDKRLQALVRDGNGAVHRVGHGNYLGSDHGRVNRISEAAIELIEIVPDGAGGWVERARTLALAGENKG